MDENTGQGAGGGVATHAIDVDAPLEVRIEGRVAAQAAVAIVCVGLPDCFEVEGVDRAHMRLPPSHDALVEAVAGVNPNVVVVLSNGSPVEMPWADRVKGILEAYLGGQAGGGAIADILT